MVAPGKIVQENYAIKIHKGKGCLQMPTDHGGQYMYN
jgi:hypothetical protein